jgi:crotonobetainyl-CoA:carnitine CoA-transferase CaiB-like acyl-CoA transferase
MTQAARPLDGVRILDLTRVLSGPYCSMILADLGAEVIKIEGVEAGDETRLNPPYAGDMGHYFLSINRGKKSVALNLRDPRGIDVARKLAARSDVLIENYRPGVLDELGLGYDALKAINPELIVCSVSGFSPDSPRAKVPAFDATVQALSGIMHLNGFPDGPPARTGVPLADLSGGIWGAIGVLAALAERGKTTSGPTAGRHVQVNMLDGLMALLGYLGQMYVVSGESPTRIGNHHHHIVPYGTYEASDGHVVIAPYSDKFWHAWCRVANRPDLASDERFAGVKQRKLNMAVLQPLVIDVMRERTVAEWRDLLEEAGVPVAEVLTVGEAMDQARARGQLTPVRLPNGELSEVFASPVNIARLGPGEEMKAAAHGEDTLAVLTELAEIDVDAIRELQEAGILGGDRV